MNRIQPSKSKPILLLLLQILHQKLKQHPTIYPIKYYKKAGRFKRVEMLQ
jgi:hypothetical protein